MDYQNTLILKIYKFPADDILQKHLEKTRSTDSRTHIDDEDDEWMTGLRTSKLIEISADCQIQPKILFYILNYHPRNTMKVWTRSDFWCSIPREIF